MKITKNSSLEEFYVQLSSVNKAKELIKNGYLKELKINGYTIKLDHGNIIVKRED